MEYIHIKSLEKYHPQYKDRNLIWCKAYFSMLNSDPEFEMLCETDKWRFIALVMLELQLKKEIPLDEPYLTRKGFDLKKRPISLTLQMLHTLIEVRNAGVTQNREDKEEEKRVDVRNKHHLSDSDFIQTLKTNPVYKGIDIDRELGKMDAYLLTKPGRTKTRKFIVAWLNRIDKPLLAEKETKYKEVDKNCKLCNGTGFVYNQSISKDEFCSCRIKSAERG